jgi:hypothetical protein
MTHLVGEQQSQSRRRAAGSLLLLDRSDSLAQRGRDGADSAQALTWLVTVGLLVACAVNIPQS